MEQEKTDKSKRRLFTFKRTPSRTSLLGSLFSKAKNRSTSGKDHQNNKIHASQKLILKESITDETGTVLYGAIFENLTEWVVLSCEEDSPNNELKAFLLTYRLFRSSKDLTLTLKKIHTSYASRSPTAKENTDFIYSKLSIFLREWSDNWPQDLEVGVFSQVLDLAEQILSPSARNVFKLKFLKLAQRKKSSLGYATDRRLKSVSINQTPILPAYGSPSITPGPRATSSSPPDLSGEREKKNNNNNNNNVLVPMNPTGLSSTTSNHLPTKQSLASPRGNLRCTDPTSLRLDLPVNETPKINPIELNALKSPRKTSVAVSMGVDVLSFRALTVAKALHFIDVEIGRNLRPTEFLDQAWQSKNKQVSAPTLSRLAERFNTISRWVATQIIVQSDRRSQVRALSKFIRVAKILLYMRNFHTLMQIISGFNNVSVARLKLEESLPSKSRDTLEKISILMSPSQNYRNYRQAQKQLPSFFPHMAVILRDVTFINDGNPTYLAPDTINFDKMLTLAKLILPTIFILRSYTTSPQNQQQSVPISALFATANKLVPTVSDNDFINSSEIIGEQMTGLKSDKHSTDLWEGFDDYLGEDVYKKWSNETQCDIDTSKYLMFPRVLEEETLYNLSLRCLPLQSPRILDDPSVAKNA